MPHAIDVDDIVRVERDAFCGPAVLLEFGNRNRDIITRAFAEGLVQIRLIAAPLSAPRPLEIMLGRHSDGLPNEIWRLLPGLIPELKKG